MERIAFILIALGLLAGMGSCKKINEATEFTISYSTTMAMPAASITVSGTQDFTTPEIESQSSSRFLSEKTTRDLIDEIRMTEFRITASKGNLDFIKSISVYIRATGLADVLVATRSNIPAGATAVNAEVTGANIKEHIFKDKIRFRATLAFNSGVTEDAELLLEQSVLVKGKKIE